MCIAEALLRQKETSGVFQRVARMFEEDCGAIVECAQSPQASLREKSKKVNHFHALDCHLTLSLSSACANLTYVSTVLHHFPVVNKRNKLRICLCSTT